MTSDKDEEGHTVLLSGDDVLSAPDRRILMAMVGRMGERVAKRNASLEPGYSTLIALDYMSKFFGMLRDAHGEEHGLEFTDMEGDSDTKH